ncbi:hypothetical protein PHSC3_000688 [Chlamydiales bacterium STE3]|nr:hypothetical protein PHSC3_000688 [Chlamydiales bacterium STE3]
MNLRLEPLNINNLLKILNNIASILIILMAFKERNCRSCCLPDKESAYSPISLIGFKPPSPPPGVFISYLNLEKSF